MRSGRVSEWARRAAGVLAASREATVGPMSRTISAVVIFAAAVPFAGWTTPLAWLGVMLAMIAIESAYAARRPATEGAAIPPFNPFTWLLDAGYSAAALYLVFFFNSAAQTLGVTLYGVVMFRILARDFGAPRRMLVNLTAPIISVAVVQIAAAVLILNRGQPWQLITLVASPYVVFRTFRAMQHHLERGRRLERDAVGRLGDSEARFRLLAEASPDILIRYDLTGRIEYLSPAAQRYGYDPAQLIGRNVAELLDPHDLERNADFLGALARGEPLPQGEQNVWRSWSANGEAVWLEGANSPLTDDRGRVIGAMAALRDVTARVALEAELRAKREEAEAAAIAKSEFLANMSHELRTPLTGVIGFAGLLDAMKTLPPDARRYVSRIHASAETLLSVVNDVLDFSKLEARQMELDIQPFDPAAFVEGVADLVRDQAAAKGLTLTVVRAPLPARLQGDAARLRQVLLNLLTNAVKFTQTGGVSVQSLYDADLGRLRFAVADTGVGVPEAVAGRLFQRFSQVDGSSTRQHGGTGLGLAISKGLVELMDGVIGMRPRRAGGSEFWFEVPAAVAAASAGDVVSEVISEVEAPPARILVVDDVKVNRELVAAMLRPFQVSIVEAGSGSEAVRAAIETPFDIILMDMQMPGMDGLAAGMNDHIAKPIDARDLLVRIARWTTPAEPAQPLAQLAN